MKHSIKVYLRAFHIWQVLGYYPWKRERAAKKEVEGGEFYKGAFDSIPFLNDDAKRTFVHLLLRPGYMIRDYINGKHDRYLAPLTALIIFYAFFSLISAALQPLSPKEEEEDKGISVELKDAPKEAPEVTETTEEVTETTEEATETSEEESDNAIEKTTDTKEFKDFVSLVKRVSRLPYLDQHPEEVDTRPEAILAAIEGSLRSKGITLFLGNFFLLWLSMGLALRKYKVRWSASAAAAAYVLCQFCFFMLFAVLLTLGKETSAGLIVQSVILVIDYRQWLSLSWRKSIGRTIRTGVFYALIWLSFWILVALVLVTVAWSRGVFSVSDFV